MSIYTAHVAIGSDDSDNINGTNGTILHAYYENNFAGNIEGIIGVNLDTGSVLNSTINSATLYWYHENYERNTGKGAATTVYGDIQIFNGSTYDEIYSFTSTLALGWKSHDLIGTELDSINSGVGGNKTNFRFTVGDPTNNPTIDPSGYRNWSVRAYEYTPVQTFSPYLVIDYTPLPVRRIFITGV